MLEAIIASAQLLILKYGYLGIALVIFAFDVVPLISPALVSETIVIFSIAAGLNKMLVITIATVTIVLASYVSYYLGYFARRRFITDMRIIKYQKIFRKYGFWAILIAGIGIVPLHVLSILAGIWMYDIKKYTLAALIGRFIRLFIFASGAILLTQLLA